MVNLNQSINAYKNYVREERKFHGSMTPKEYGIQIMKRRRKMERQHDMEELSVNISYCPYCGSKNIIRINDVDCTCNDCGRDYMVITHE